MGTGREGRERKVNEERAWRKGEGREVGTAPPVG